MRIHSNIASHLAAGEISKNPLFLKKKVEYFIVYLFEYEYIKLIENIIIITAVTNHWPPGIVVALMPTRQDVDRIETLIVALLKLLTIFQRKFKKQVQNARGCAMFAQYLTGSFQILNVMLMLNCASHLII